MLDPAEVQVPAPARTPKPAAFAVKSRLQALGPKLHQAQPVALPATPVSASTAAALPLTISGPARHLTHQEQNPVLP